jgi:hypothetical protein
MAYRRMDLVPCSPIGRTGGLKSGSGKQPTHLRYAAVTEVVWRLRGLGRDSARRRSPPSQAAISSAANKNDNCLTDPAQLA